MEEQWRDILGYEGYYQVSDQGSVKSVERKVKHYYGERIVPERIKTPSKSKGGYLSVILYKDGEEKRYLVHRLVAYAFIPNLDGLPQINHKDENKENNTVENLEWCTAEYNINYGTRNEKIKKIFGKPVLCVETGITYSSIMEIERQFGYNQSNIAKCCNGKKYYHTAYGYHWKYVEENKKTDFSLF